MDKPIKIIGINVKYVGNREKSKQDGLILFDFVAKLFEHNHKCKRKDRLQDHQILALVKQEFSNRDINLTRNFCTVWRRLFNHGLLRGIKPEFVAYRVNSKLQFCKTKSETKGLTITQLFDDYEKYGLDLKKDLRMEVRKYSYE